MILTVYPESLPMEFWEFYSVWQYFVFGVSSFECIISLKFQHNLQLKSEQMNASHPSPHRHKSKQINKLLSLKQIKANNYEKGFDQKTSGSSQFSKVCLSLTMVPFSLGFSSSCLYASVRKKSSYFFTPQSLNLPAAFTFYFLLFPSNTSK